MYLYLCYFCRTNIFGYLFGKYVASEYIWIFVRYIMWHPKLFGYLFVSILCYLFITARRGSPVNGNASLPIGKIHSNRQNFQDFKTIDDISISFRVYNVLRLCQIFYLINYTVFLTVLAWRRCEGHWGKGVTDLVNYLVY